MAYRETNANGQATASNSSPVVIASDNTVAVSGTVADRTDLIYNSATALTPKFAKANVAASQTDSSIVAAVTSKKIRVLSYTIITAASATNITFNSKPAGAGTAISSLKACGVNDGVHASYCPVGHFETVAGEGLTVTTSAGSTTGIDVVYVEV